MPGLSDEERAMFAGEMSDGEYAQLLLIDMQMADTALPVEVDPTMTRKVNAATQAAAQLLQRDMTPAHNVIPVNFGNR